MDELARPDGTTLGYLSLGPDDGPVTLLAHGTGSSPEFVLRALGPSVVAAGGRAVAWWLRGHGGPCEGGLALVDQVGDMEALVELTGARALGGVSLGAHLAALVAAASPASFDSLLAVMPAWTGAPGPVARLNAGQATGIDANGIAAEIERITRDHPGWVADELAASWPSHDPAAFARILRAVSTMPAPTLDQLAAITARTTVVALTGDPMHPVAVAREWAAAIRGARLVEVTGTAVATDRTVLAGGPSAQL